MKKVNTAWETTDKVCDLIEQAQECIPYLKEDEDYYHVMQEQYDAAPIQTTSDHHFKGASIILNTQSPYPSHEYCEEFGMANDYIWFPDKTVDELVSEVNKIALKQKGVAS